MLASMSRAFDQNTHGQIFKNDDPEDEMFQEVYPPNPLLDVNRNRRILQIKCLNFVFINWIEALE